jgi:hypothetical protein
MQNSAQALREAPAIDTVSYMVQMHKRGIITPDVITDAYRAKMGEIEKTLRESADVNKKVLEIAGQLTPTEMQTYDLVGIAADVQAQGLFNGFEELNFIANQAYTSFQKSIKA